MGHVAGALSTLRLGIVHISLTCENSLLNPALSKTPSASFLTRSVGSDVGGGWDGGGLGSVGVSSTVAVAVAADSSTSSYDERRESRKRLHFSVSFRSLYGLA